MVRLVFRPYTQIRRTICTSVSLRASTRVSPGFALFRHRSPSFGSQQICSYSNLSQVPDRSIVPPGPAGQGSYLSSTRLPLLSLRTRVYHPNTRIYVRLLGPCFKTGQLKPFRQHPKQLVCQKIWPNNAADLNLIQGIIIVYKTNSKIDHLPITFYL